MAHRCSDLQVCGTHSPSLAAVQFHHHPCDGLPTGTPVCSAQHWVEIPLDTHKFVCEVRPLVAEQAQGFGIWLPLLRSRSVRVWGKGVEYRVRSNGDRRLGGRLRWREMEAGARNPGRDWEIEAES